MRPYQPSNGSEGVWFISTHCALCERDRQFRKTQKGPGCEILSRSMLFDPGDKEYPEEWVCDDKPTCTAFEAEKTNEEREHERMLKVKARQEQAGQLRLF